MVTGADMMVSPVERRLGQTQSIYCNIINIENVNGVEFLDKAMTAFSGADMIVELDGVPTGEIMNIEYDEDVYSGRVIGHITTAMFQTDMEIRKRIMQTKTVLIRFKTEEGERKTEELTGFELHTISRKRSTSANVVTTTYQFLAEFVEEGVPA